MDHFLVVDPPGGKGDQLIFLGMKKKLRELGITYRVLHYKRTNFFRELCFEVKKLLSPLRARGSVVKKLKSVRSAVQSLAVKNLNKIGDASADIVLIRGGGYFNDLWKDYDILENALRNDRDCVIMVAPHSLCFDTTQFPEFFERSEQEIYLFCRERYSYKLLRSMSFPKNVHVFLSHDTALYLSKEDFHPRNGSYDLICPREDRESVVTWKIEGSNHRKILVGDIESVPDFTAFVNLIENARRVYTDRLHVAILSAILGKDTFLYPNSYPKNKGVYEFSLYKFSNVRFVDSLKFLGIENFGS